MIRYHTTTGILCQIVMCLALVNTSCKPPDQVPTEYSAYYFPVDGLPEDGLRYTYRNMSDTTAGPEVWRYLNLGGGRIEGINYGPDQEVVQRQFDHIVSNGVIIDSLLLYYSDSNQVRQPIKVKILSPHRFPFLPGDSSNVWLTHLEWNQPVDSLHIVLQRRRRFAGQTTWEMHGKTIPAIRFNTEDTFETERDGWTSSSWTGEEIYAKGVGLVYYRRKISEQLVLEFELENRE